MQQMSEDNIRRINYLMTEIDALYHQAAVKMGLSDSVARVLYTIYEAKGSCLLSEIYKKTGVSKQTINSALRKLEQEGILYLEPSGARSKRVCLTETGLRVADTTAGRLIRLENSIFDEWPAEDVQQYLGLMERYLQAFRCKLPELGGQE